MVWLINRFNPKLGKKEAVTTNRGISNSADSSIGKPFVFLALKHICG